MEHTSPIWQPRRTIGTYFWVIPQTITESQLRAGATCFPTHVAVFHPCPVLSPFFHLRFPHWLFGPHSCPLPILTRVPFLPFTFLCFLDLTSIFCCPITVTHLSPNLSLSAPSCSYLSPSLLSSVPCLYPFPNLSPCPHRYSPSCLFLTLVPSGPVSPRSLSPIPPISVTYLSFIQIPLSPCLPPALCPMGHWSVP